MQRNTQQKQQARLCTFHQRADLRRVMRAQVVENDDVARVEPRHQAFADEVDELWAIDGAIERLVSENSVGSDSSDDADVLAPIGGLMVDDSLPARRATICRRHRDVAARLVDEDQAIRRDLLTSSMNAMRLSSTPLRSCSDGRKRFFSSDPCSLQRPQHARPTEVDAIPRAPLVFELVERGVRHGSDEPKQIGKLLLTDSRRKAATSGLRNDMAQLTLSSQQPGNSCLADTKSLRQFEVRTFVPLIRGNNAAPQIQR